MSVALSRGQHAELMAVGIGQDHPADLALADVDTRRAEGEETVDLGPLITVEGWRDVEVQPVLSGFRLQWRTAPGELGTAVRRGDPGLLGLVPGHRPGQRPRPQVPELL